MSRAEAKAFNAQVGMTRSPGVGPGLSGRAKTGPMGGAGVPQGANVRERAVRCYHCARDVGVPESAHSASCPVCFKGLVLDDLSVTSGGYGRAIATCGIVTVEKKARVITKKVEAGIGVEVWGYLEAKTVAQTVVVGKKGVLKGEIEAERLWVDAGGAVDAVVRIGKREGQEAPGTRH